MRKVATFCIVVCAMAVSGYVIYLFGREIYRLYVQATPEVRLGVMTAAGSAAAFIINNAIQSSRERRARLFDAKRTTYDKFFQLFFSFFASQRSGEEIDAVEDMQDFVRSVMTWGSAQTINSLIQFQLASIAKTADDELYMFPHVERLLRALRKDLGHADGSLQNMALAKLIVKADEHHRFERIKS
jgi:hypothetical protein